MSIDSGVLFLGCSGVGKSFLCNILLGRQQFLHDFRASAVTTKSESAHHSFKMKNGYNMNATVFNVPGLIENNPEAIRGNKVEIQRAFAQCPFSIVVFVFECSGGRLREEDITAFTELDRAYQFNRASLCFVFNQLRKRRPAAYDGQATALLQQHIKAPGALRVSFIETLDDHDFPGKAVAQQSLINIIEACVPASHIQKVEIEINRDRLRREEEAARAKQAALAAQVAAAEAERKRIAALPPPPPVIQHIHHYHSDSDDDGGCVIM